MIRVLPIGEVVGNPWPDPLCDCCAPQRPASTCIKVPLAKASTWLCANGANELAAALLAIISSPQRLELEFGALAPPIEMQLRDAGFQPTVLEALDLEMYQGLADAIVRLSLHRHIPARAIDSARRELVQRIASAIRETR